MLIITFLRSLIFCVFYVGILLILSVILLILNIFKCKKISEIIIKKWVQGLVLLSKYICGINYKVAISPQFNPDETYLMLMKHESTWETYFLYQFFDLAPVPVAKKELRYIPIFGQMLSSVDSILLDRSNGLSSIKTLIKQAKYYLIEKKKSILIAPQGTRVPLSGTIDEYPYKSGFIGVAGTCNVPILPIILDSGKCWPKNGFMKYSGTINVKILDPISIEKIKQMNKEELTDYIANIMEDERKKMND